MGKLSALKSTQQALPCSLVRGGTSKGTFFLKEDLPSNIEERNKVLLRIMGSPHASQIDGIGGGSFVTSKVAIIAKSSEKNIDVDYYFVQVMVDEAWVDDKPTCGNVLSGVGIFAIEAGLKAASDPVTEVIVRDKNTGAQIKQIIQTPGGKITYAGETKIAGVPGTAAPIELQFQEIVGGITGKYLPTGNASDVIDGVEMTCLDICMPTVMMMAKDFSNFGISGYETPAELNANKPLLSYLLQLRKKASLLMGMGDAEGKVIPKLALLSPATQGGDFSIRYFTPKTCHPSVAISAGFGFASSCFIKNTLIHRLAGRSLLPGSYAIKIENPSGITPICVKFKNDIESVVGSTTRTARMLFRGETYY